jgi:hypothetical protein
LFAWLQLIISIAIAGAAIWGYTTYQASLGKFTQSVAASIVAVSNVVGRTAETIKAKQSLLDQTGKTLLATRNLIKELQVIAENQARVAPQYAEGIRGTSALVGSLSGTLHSIGDGMMFSVPTDIKWRGTNSTIIRSRPLENQAQALMARAKDFKAVSDSLLAVSTTVGQDGAKLSLAFIATTQQVLKMLEETESTLGRIKSNDLPKALVDLRETSENLRSVSEQVNVGGSFSKALLIVGLLLAGWCFFGSLSTLMLANSRPVASVTNRLRR